MAEKYVGEVLDVIPERDYKGAPELDVLWATPITTLQVVFEGSESSDWPAMPSENYGSRRQ